jgi:LPS-assembly lipoprotein
MSLRLLFVLATISALSACGFHLRGAEPLPPGVERIYIEMPSGSPLRYELESLLLAAGGEVVKEKSAATSLLVVQSATIRSRTLSLDTLGQASEYGLTLSVKYSLQSEGGTIVDQPLSSRVERDFRLDPDNVLGRGAEREMVEREMYRVAAEQMLRRLRALHSQ